MTEIEIYTPEQYAGTGEFVHCHSHSIFSVLDGIATPEQYAERCAEWGHPGMAITEHGHMASVPDMHFAFKKHNLKFIPGCEIYFNDFEPKRQVLEQQGIKYRSPEWRKQNPELAARISRNRHLTVLCKNEIGFHNLVKLTTQAYETGLFGMGRTQYNRIWFEKLCEFKEGLIILSGCLNGPVAHELRSRAVMDREGNVLVERDRKKCVNDAVQYIKKFRKIFGEDYYIELQMPGIPGTDIFPSDVEVFHDLIALADHFKIKTALANDCHYLVREDFVLQKIMMAVAQETTIDSPDLFHVNSDEQYMKSRGDLWSRFKNEYSKGLDDRCFEHMCDNTLEIADKCDKFYADSTPKNPSIRNEDEVLTRIVATELKKRGLDKNTEKFIIDGREVTYVDQAKLELKRFIDKGFASYFLITRDLVQFGKARGWPFSPRGCSVPDSLVKMADGTDRKIIDINIGDQVLDGFGATRNVENKFIYEVSEELVELELEDGTVLRISDDHKLYVVRDGLVILVRACELIDTDEVIDPCS